MWWLLLCGAWALGRTVVTVATRGLSSTDSVVVVHRLSCPEACGILVPQPGIEPTSPVFSALQADSLPSEPLRKSHRAVLEVKKINMYKFLELCLAW